MAKAPQTEQESTSNQLQTNLKISINMQISIAFIEK